MTGKPSTRCTHASDDVWERFFISTLRGKKRLFRKWKDTDGRIRNQVLPLTDDDLNTVEGVIKAKAKWKRELISYPCHWCGKPIEMTLQELRFLSIHMLNRYDIGALPVCSKECADNMVREYNKGKHVIQENTPKEEQRA